jgi:tetratricopeptide (TPR) repeat protein
MILLIGLALALNIAVFAQSESRSSQSGSRRGFTLYGDLKVEESQGGVETSSMFDVILYTAGNQVVARERVGNGGRYRFNNVFNGEYYLAVELDNVEVARVTLQIPENAVEHIRQDLEFRWKGGLRSAGGVLSARDTYNRTNQNRTLYDRAMKEINNRKFSKAVELLRSLLESDPKDFPAWSELGMVYFTQKEFEAAENSFLKAIEAKPDHVPSLVSLGRVRLARKNSDAAIEALQAALKADPQSPSANYFMGEAYLALRQGSQAARYLNEAIKIDPLGMADAHLRLATLYNLAGSKERAAIEYNEFLKKRPDYPDGQKLRDYIIANGPRSKPKPNPSPSPSPNP